jgi:hypothetical protein
MPSTREKLTRAAAAELAARGLLLRADARLPCVVGLVVGGPVRGSWWSHPKAHDIYAVCEGLNHHPDAAIAKLVAGKVTYVHRALWPALVSVGEAREPWQMRGLSAAARSLLELVAASGSVRADEVRDRRLADRRAVSAAARELELRLLVRAKDVHTERGAHAKQLEAWPSWAARVAVPAQRPSASAARAVLEERCAALAGPGATPARLPWLRRAD